MKGKKCIKFLILFITFLLCLSPYLDASAIETYVASTNPSKITYIFRNDDGVETNQTINLQTGFTGNIYFNPNSLKFQSMKRLNIELSASRQFSKTQRFKLKYYAKVHYEDNYSDTLMSVFNCPDGVNGFRIYYCDIQQLSQSQVINEIRQYPDSNNQQYPFFYTTSTSNDIYYVVELKGYYISDSLTSKTLIETDQHFFLIRNNGTSNLTPLVQLNFYFTTIDIFKEEDSAEDEAAEKELEDRDNLETQSSTTENQADDAGNAAETTGTTLFGAFTQLFSALTNVNGNSCTLPNMQVYSLELGQMNLCTYTIPPQIMALVSIGMVFIIVPLGIHLVKRMISLYKEITG